MVEQVRVIEAVERPPRSAGKVVVVAGTRAGVGRTTVAVGLAMALAGGESRVALIDLDLRLGNLAGQLGIKPGGDVLSALAPGVLEDLGRLRAQLAWGPSGVDVLPAPPPDDRRVVDPARIARLLSSLEELYDFVIVDTAPGVDDVNKIAFAAAERVLLVVTPELTAVEMDPALPRDRTEVVLNRVSVRAKKGADANGSLGLPVAWRLGEGSLADDVRPLARALSAPPPPPAAPAPPAPPAPAAPTPGPSAEAPPSTGRGLLGPRLLIPVAALALVGGGIWFATQRGGEVATPAAPPAAQSQPAATAPPATATAVPTAPPATATTVPATATRAPATATAPPATATAAPATATAPPATATAAPPTATARPLNFRTVLDERFSDAKRGWPSKTGSTAWVADGAYNLVARQPGRFVAVRAPGGLKLRDGIVSATFRKTGGPVGGGYGLIVRDQGGSAGDGVDQTGRYYVLEVGDKGDVGAWRRDGDRWVDLVPWMRSDRVKAGQETNTLSVRTVGSKITFLVGDAEVLSFEDTALNDGAVGVFAGGDLNAVQLERFTVQESQ